MSRYDAFGDELGGDEPEGPINPAETPPVGTRELISYMQRHNMSPDRARELLQQHFGSRTATSTALDRRAKNAVQISPTRVIGPRPEDFPHIRERKRVLHMSSETDSAFDESILMDANATIYGISGGFRGKIDGQDIYTYGLEGFTVQFLRKSTSDPLSDAPAIASAIVGTAERPTPIATPGWYFQEGAYLQALGEAFGTEWDIWLVFHCVDFVAASNLGMPRSVLWHTGDEVSD